MSKPFLRHVSTTRVLGQVRSIWHMTWNISQTDMAQNKIPGQGWPEHFWPFTRIPTLFKIYPKERAPARRFDRLFIFNFVKSHFAKTSTNFEVNGNKGLAVRKRHGAIELSLVTHDRSLIFKEKTIKWSLLIREGKQFFLEMSRDKNEKGNLWNELHVEKWVANELHA